MTDKTETEAPQENPENISDLFDDDSVTEETSEESTEESSTEESDETSSKEESEETADESKGEDTEPPSEEEGSVPRKALLEERRKRQELEKRVQELEPDDEEAPDPTDDPDGYEKYLRTKWEREQWAERANKSRDRMLEKHSDYEEKERHFLFLANQDPELIKQMNEDPDPAAFAYTKAVESMEAQEKAIEERVLERLKKEGKLKEEKASTASKVSDLTSATGAGKNTEEDVKESTDPQDVFDDLAY